MPRYYTKKEEFKIIYVDEILPYVEKAPDEDSRFVIALAWLTGARIQEIVNLTGKNFRIDDTDKTVNIYSQALKFGKQSNFTFSFSDPFIRDIVIPWVSRKMPWQRLTMKGKRRHEQIMKELNMQIHGNDTSQWIVFHQLRHSRTTFLAREMKAFPEELKAWFGHRSSAFEEYIAPRRVDRFRGKMR